ncbi:MAG: plasmid pRiA4b ORF-3 family protein, partial [Eubacteriaceae bacterium]|nr:plasmid pRiA4b ORF-3 family protein [Eubacteriaceae bacterium]
MASSPIYQFFAELDDYKPTIWRRFQVMDNITVARLGYILQVLFEMTASHLMAIEVPAVENSMQHIKNKYPDLMPRLADRYSKRLFNMSINVDKWYNNAKKAVYHYMRNKYPSDITRDQFEIIKPFLESATEATRPYKYD